MLGIKLIVGAMAVATAASAAGAQATGTPAFGTADGAASPKVVWNWPSTESGDIDGATALLGPRFPWPSLADGDVADARDPIDGTCALLGRCGVPGAAGVVQVYRLDPAADGR